MKNSEPKYADAKEKKDAKRARQAARMAEIRLTPEWKSRHEAYVREHRIWWLKVAGFARFADLSRLMTRGTGISDLSGEIINVRYPRNKKSSKETSRESSTRIARENIATARKEQDTLSASFDGGEISLALWGLGEGSATAVATRYLRQLQIPLSFVLIKTWTFENREKPLVTVPSKESP